MKQQRSNQIVMNKARTKEQIGGAAVRVADPHIWASICYLDSPNNYREYLAGNRRGMPRPEGDLVMLDDKYPPDWITSLYFIVGVLLVLAMSIALMRNCA
jgi:hypothetical protein